MGFWRWKLKKTYKTCLWPNLKWVWCFGRTCRKQWLLFACLTDLQSFLNWRDMQSVNGLTLHLTYSYLPTFGKKVTVCGSQSQSVNHLKMVYRIYQDLSTDQPIASLGLGSYQPNMWIWAPPTEKQRSLGSEASEICHLNSCGEKRILDGSRGNPKLYLALCICTVWCSHSMTYYILIWGFP